jgi:hypothetical protein
MLTKDIGTGRRGVVDLRAKPKTEVAKVQPVKIQSDFEPIPKAKAGIGKVMFGLLLLLAVVAVVAGWWFLSKPQSSNSTSLKITVDTPKQVKAGEEFTIKINYQNIDTAVLQKMQLTMEHSPLWHLRSAEVMPEDENQSFWKLDDLAVSSNKELNLVGVLYGDNNQDNDFTLKFGYRPENFSSQFEDVVKFKIGISQAYFAQTKTLPTEVNLDDNAVLELAYKYQGEMEATSTDFELSLPEGVKVASSSPMISNNVWQFPTWSVDEEKKIQLQLVASESVEGQWQISAKHQGEEVGLWTGNIKVNAPSLVVAVERTDSGNINYGDKLNLRLRIKNNSTGNTSLSWAEVKVDSNLIDWSKVNIADAEIKDKTIIWATGKGEINKKILAMKAGAEEKMDFSLPLLTKANLNNLETGDQTSIKLSSQAQLSNINETKEISGAGLELNISRPFSVTATGRYYASADSLVGSGPLPPQVGKKTSYQIVWTVFAGDEGLKNLRFTSGLPSYIDWGGQDEEVSGGGVVGYDQTNKKIEWTIDSLAAGRQVSVAFMVNATPSDSQINQLLILTNAANFTAKREVSSTTINNNLSLITSELPDDPVASGKGRVRAQ